jgi:hypothetical protein
VLRRVLREDANDSAEQTPQAWEQLLALRAQGVKSGDSKYAALEDKSELDSYGHVHLNSIGTGHGWV